MQKDKWTNCFSNLLIKGFKGLLLGSTIYFVGKTLMFHMSQIQWLELTVLKRFVFLSVFFEISARYFTGFCYNLLLKFTGTPLPLKICVSVSWVSFLGKYLPGKIAMVASSIYLLKYYKVPATLAGIVPVFCTLITIVVALVLSIPLLFLGEHQIIVTMNSIVALVFVLFLLFNSTYLFSLFNLIFRRLGIPETKIRYSSSQIAACAGVICLQCICAGISTWMVTRAICPADLSLMPMIVSITAFSGVMGLLAFFSPAGIGVRDGLYFIALARLVDPESAVVIVLILRLIQTILDLGTAGFGALILYADKKKHYKEASHEP